MKILHTGDWHLGRLLNQRSFLEDQTYALDGLITLISNEKPDVVLIAGDLYDRFIPPKEAVSLMDHCFSRIVLDLKIPVIAIGGNHDGGERLNFASGILEQRGLHIHGTYDLQRPPVVLSDPWGDVAFWSVPFLKPVEYKNITGESVEDFDEMYAGILSHLAKQMNPNIRNILITHGMVLSGDPEENPLDDSVRPLNIGGVSYAKSSRFDAFDYVALGHLHRPQKVGREGIRYSGSLLKYSFSEVNQKKSVTMIDLKNKGNLTINTLPLPHLRDLRIISGYLDDLIAPENREKPESQDYLKIVLKDETRKIQPMDTLKKVYPNALEMSYENLEISTPQSKGNAIKEQLDQPLELFTKFYELIHGFPLNEEKKQVVKSIMEETQGGIDNETN